MNIANFRGIAQSCVAAAAVAVAGSAFAAEGGALLHAEGSVEVKAPPGACLGAGGRLSRYSPVASGRQRRHAVGG